MYNFVHILYELSWPTSKINAHIASIQQKSENSTESDWKVAQCLNEFLFYLCFSIIFKKKYLPL